MIKTEYSLENFSDYEIMTRGGFFIRDPIVRAIGSKIASQGFIETLNDPSLTNTIAVDYFGEAVVTENGDIVPNALDVQVVYSDNGAKVDKVLQALKPSFTDTNFFRGGMLVSIYPTHISVTYEAIDEITLLDNIVYNAIMIRILLILTRSLDAR